MLHGWGFRLDFSWFPFSVSYSDNCFNISAIFMPMPEIKISPCIYETYLRADGHTGICGGAQTDAMHHHRLQRQLFPVFAEIIISSVCRDNSKDSTRRLNTAQVLG
jgi:hypothetical protein